MIQGYNSHVPLLDRIFKLFEIKRVLEFGMGKGSTPYFLKKNTRLISIETNMDWAFEYYGSGRGHVILIHSEYWLPKIFNDLNLQKIKFDVIFIDGPLKSRVPCAKASLGHARFIIMHDTDIKSYGWDKLKIPRGYRQYIFKEHRPWTTVISKDGEAIEKLRQK